MRAIILAGGKGRRLAPHTTALAKPLMSVGGMPILEVILRQLKNHRSEEITLAVGDLSEHWRMGKDFQNSILEMDSI